MKKTLLITGAKGMLGCDVVRSFSRTTKWNLIPVDIDDFDICNAASVQSYIQKFRPDVCLHLAAYTQVDNAEKERDLCLDVNFNGTRNLANALNILGAEMIYISTDYVFDGTKQSPYIETDPTHPINVYGLSKRKGEEIIELVMGTYKIVRASWLCGLYGKNFIETMIRLGKERSEINVVSDQRGCPTFTFDLAEALMHLVEVPKKGIFHITNGGSTTWREFAEEIFSVAGIRTCRVNPITSEQYATPARRPLYSVLQNTRLTEYEVLPLPHWKESLKEYFRRLSI